MDRYTLWQAFGSLTTQMLSASYAGLISGRRLHTARSTENICGFNHWWMRWLTNDMPHPSAGFDACKPSAVGSARVSIVCFKWHTMLQERRWHIVAVAVVARQHKGLAKHGFDGQI